MCKLMFGEHREKITQIILTAAEENVIFAIKGKLEGKVFFFHSFLSFLSFSGKEKNCLSGSELCIIKKQKGNCCMEVIMIELQKKEGSDFFSLFYPKAWCQKQRQSSVLLYQFIIQWVYTPTFHS